MLVQQQAAADAQVIADLDRLTLEELREYRRLEAKARGAPDMIRNRRRCRRPRRRHLTNRRMM